MSSLFSKPITTVATKSLVSVPDINQTLLTTVSNSDKPAKFDLAKVEGPDIVMYGSERQKEIGHRLDDLLGEITKGSSPVLFELFNQLKKGVHDTNLGELEQKIRTSLDKKWYHALLDSVGLSSSVKRLQNANISIDSVLTSKTKSLLDLTKSMEDKIQGEVIKLIQDSGRLATLALEFRKDILTFGDYVTVGREILADAKQRLQISRPPDSETDPLKIQDYKNFEQKVQLFESRLMVLEAVLAKSPGDLEVIRLSQGASLSTIGEVASNSLQDFNEIKSSLIQLSVSFQIKSVQSLNDQRRELRDNLATYGSDVLQQVAVKASQDSGLNRLNDAQKLLDAAKKIKDTSDKVANEQKANQERFSQARQKLEEVKKMMAMN